MPLTTQAKLLRVLQEKEFERVGGTKSIRVDVRFIASTNKNLTKLVQEGKFREDLFYRLNVFSLYLPPLRERREDIPSLAQGFVETAPKTAEISPKALQTLMGFNWPGNVRELKNVIERAAVMAEDGTIEPQHLPVQISGAWSVRPYRRSLNRPASMTGLRRSRSGLSSMPSSGPTGSRSKPPRSWGSRNVASGTG